MSGQVRSLSVSFESVEDFQREYATNIANGGIFVAGEEDIPVRQAVSVTIDLAWAGESLCLRGEVVHAIPVDLATAGATPGVAVQFEIPAGELRQLFEPFVAGVPSPEESERETGRRSAPRSKARVRARVHCPGYDDIEGRTRNLSSSGVLVSVSDGTIGVGEPVQVFITNPKTGEEREILGKVARHVQSEGGVVRAVGIQFYMSDSERRGVEGFLKELTAAEHNRHLGGIQGAIEELGLVNLLQTFGMAAPEGTLDVIRGADEGYIAFEGGSLRAARIGGVQGVKALARMLAWPDGQFEFHACVDRELPAGEPIPLDAALLDAMRLMDESAGVNRASFPPQATLCVVLDRRDGSACDFTKLEEAILDLAAVGTSVPHMLDIIPETDAEIYMALDRLVEAEVLSVRT